MSLAPDDLSRYVVQQAFSLVPCTLTLSIGYPSTDVVSVSVSDVVLEKLKLWCG